MKDGKKTSNIINSNTNNYYSNTKIVLFRKNQVLLVFSINILINKNFKFRMDCNTNTISSNTNKISSNTRIVGFLIYIPNKNQKRI